MKTSDQFTHVPYIGYGNVIEVTDNDTGDDEKFIVSLDGLAPSAITAWVPKADNGDEGNLDLGGSVSSYTNKDPNGRAGNMITHLELLGEGGEAPVDANFLVMVAIPSGMSPSANSPLLDKKYSLSNQPPDESFDYSKFLPRVDVRGCYSLYGGEIPGSSGYYPFSALTPTGRFPSIPMLPPFTGGVGGPLFYLPPGFYGNINTILNDLFSPTNPFDIELVTQPQYGILCLIGQFDAGQDNGSGCFTVDFSHSGTN